MTWTNYARKHGGRKGEGVFVSLRASCIAFSADFARLYIGDCSRVKVFTDAELYRLGFVFNDDIDDANNYMLCQDGNKSVHGRVFVCQKMLHTYPWVAAALALPTAARRFTPKREEMGTLAIWFIELPRG